MITWRVSSKYLAVKNLQYMLSTVGLFLVLLLSWLLWWTDLLVLFFVRVTNRRLRSALTSALDSAKNVHCKGPAALSSPLSRRRRVIHVVSDILPGHSHQPQIDVPKHDRHVHTHVHCENRSLIQSLTLMCSAIKLLTLSWACNKVLFLEVGYGCSQVNVYLVLSN